MIPPDGVPERLPEHAIPLDQARERVIESLSLHFAHDHLSLDELESRLERAYQARTVVDLVALTADLPSTEAAGGTAAARSTAASSVPAPADDGMLAPERERMLSIMAETKRLGVWAVPQRLEILAVMSDTTLDLTRAVLPGGIVDIHVRAVWAAVKIIVPPGVHVVSRLSAFMASVVNGAGEGGGPPVPPGAPVIRLTGFATMAEVKTVVRTRESGEL